MAGLQFDVFSALIGSILTLIAVALVYLLRVPLVRIGQAAAMAASSLTHRLTAGAGQQYRELVARWACGASALSHLAPLDQVFVSPPLIPPPPHPDPEAKHPPAGRTISLAESLSGHNRVLLLGQPASGRTTLLAYLAHVYAREQVSETLGLPIRRLPLYVRLCDLEWTPPAETAEEPSDRPPRHARETPPLQRLTEAAVAAVGGSSRQATVLREHLTAGTALILLDGWDELEEEARDTAAAWIGQLADELPGNLWIATAGTERFFPLTARGFVPLRLGRWDPGHARLLAQRWADTLRPQSGGEMPDPAPLFASLTNALRKGATPLELTLRGWLFFSAEALPERRVDLFLAATDRLSQPKEDELTWLPAAMRAMLSNVALTLQVEQRTTITRQELEEAVEAVLPPEGERPARARERVLQTLTVPGSILQPYGADRYAFVHPVWMACLVARHVAALSPGTVLEHVNDPRWLPVLDFYAELGPMEPVLKAWLAQPDDLWRTRLRTAARWAALAPPEAQWRNPILALLARTMLQTEAPAPIRHAVAESFIQTGDPGVTYFLKQAVRHPDAGTRVVAVRALGHLAQEADLPTLEAALRDDSTEVRAAAVEALATMGTRAAVLTLARLLVETELDLQTEAARALAHCGEEGQGILEEALQHDDLLTRRAVVFGMAELGQPWAEERLGEIARDDPEWIVRSAAETVLEREEIQPQRVRPPIRLSEAGWLIAWAAERGDPVGQGDAAFPTLLQALAEGSPAIQQAAARALGLIGRPEHIPAVRRAMESQDQGVASASLEALEEICHRHGEFVGARAAAPAGLDI